MKLINKYAVYVEWNYAPAEKDSFERCCIYHPEEDVLEFDGDNMVCGSGNSGFNFDVYDTLEDAIIKSGFNATYIDFQDIDAKEITDVLSHYMWLEDVGYVKVPIEINDVD